MAQHRNISQKSPFLHAKPPLPHTTQTQPPESKYGTHMPHTHPQYISLHWNRTRFTQNNHTFAFRSAPALTNNSATFASPSYAAQCSGVRLSVSWKGKEGEGMGRRRMEEKHHGAHTKQYICNTIHMTKVTSCIQSHNTSQECDCCTCGHGCAGTVPPPSIPWHEGRWRPQLHNHWDPNAQT